MVMGNDYNDKHYIRDIIYEVKEGYYNWGTRTLATFFYFDWFVPPIWVNQRMINLPNDSGGHTWIPIQVIFSIRCLILFGRDGLEISNWIPRYRGLGALDLIHLQIG